MSTPRRSAGATVIRTALPLLILSALFTTQDGWADTARTSMRISATVVARASVVDLASPVPVTITAADLARGYLDVSRTYRLRSNSPRGLLLQLNPRVGLTRSIDVSGLTSPLQLGDAGAEVAEPASDALRLRFRLWLQPGAVPGEYPLPVHLAAVPI